VSAAARLGAVLLAFALGVPGAPAWAQTERVIDVPTRPGVSERLLFIALPSAKATVILFAGGHGGLRLAPDGKIGWGAGNFLVRTRQMLAAQSVNVATLDAPSDRQGEPFLNGFRQTREHAADVKAVIATLRQQQAGVPVWLMGTSRGTQSVAYLATELPRDAGGPDGVVLTSTILTERRGSRAVPGMPLQFIKVPVLVVHHKDDGCDHCRYTDLPLLTEKLTAAPRKEVIVVEGGATRGDPCEAFAHHGYNGIEQDVITKIAAWIVR
jgi:hypothetical protein